MARCSNTLVGILNVFLFLLSIPMLCIGVYLSLHGSTQCARFLEKPMIFLGVFLMVVSIAGVIGSCCRVTWFLWLHLVLMCFLIVLLISFTIFAFVVSSKGAGETIPGKAYKEYRLETYSKWLQKRVSHGKNWNNIRSCLFESGFCANLEKVSGRDTVSVFDKSALSSLESGCCKPSNDCNFIYVSPTNWTTTSLSGGNNSDCELWDGGDSKKLCYDCEACKAGFLDSIKSSLESVAVGNIFILVFLIIFYATGCCAMRNNKKEDIYGSSHGSYKI